MKQQLWVVNSSLLGIFLTVLALGHLLHHEAPMLRTKKIIPNLSPKKDSFTPVSLEHIYQNDIFGTFIALPPPPPAAPSQKFFATPVPEPRLPNIPPPPEQKKQEFVSPLGIALRGIIISSDEARNVAMIADETNKEGLYHIGEKIKDAQILKIARNRVVFLRANGQQETFFLRKEDNKLDQTLVENVKKSIRSVDSFNFNIDPDMFTQAVDSLGNFIEQLPLIGMAFFEGAPIGIRIGNIDKKNIGEALGLKSYDIIVAVNNLATSEPKNRLAAYDIISSARLGDSISVQIRRAQSDLFYTYHLTRLDQAMLSIRQGSDQSITSGQPLAGVAEKSAGRTFDRETTLRKFKKKHPNPQRQKTMTDMRKKLMDNLRTRTQRQRK